MPSSWDWNKPHPDDVMELAPFDAAFRGAWAWEQFGRFHPRWRLTCAGAPVATLAIRPLLFGTSVARFRDATWSAHYRFPARLELTRDGDTAPTLTHRPGWFGRGTITLAGDGGAELKWRPEGFWMRSWSLSTPDLNPLVRFHSTRAFLHHGATIELEDAARRRADLPALLVLGWMLIMHTSRSHHGA